MSNNKPMTKTTFAPPEQKGNITIYPALPAEMLRTTHGRKIRTAPFVVKTMLKNCLSTFPHETKNSCTFVPQKNLNGGRRK